MKKIILIKHIETFCTRQLAAETCITEDRSLSGLHNLKNVTSVAGWYLIGVTIITELAG